MYSAANVNSSIVADKPRFNKIGLFVRPASLSNSKFCIFLAPIWKTSKYSSAISKSAGFTISLTILRLNLSLTFFNILSPSIPNPWKSYGDVLGLNAPPLMNFSPLACKSRATASTCS